MKTILRFFFRNIFIFIYSYIKDSALYVLKFGGNSFELSKQFLKHQIILEFLFTVLMMLTSN